MEITENISIEDLVEQIPSSVKYLSEKGIQCVVCGEPVWGTLKEICESKGFSQEQIQCFLGDLKKMSE